MSANTTVYTGIWTNWAKGVVSGVTLTLPVRDGGILIAVLALFVQLSSGQSWSIICYIAHQIRTHPEARHGLFHQQQATLRNNSSDIRTLWKLINLGWTWRSHDIKSVRKSTPLVITGLLHLLLFGAAGVFSSHLATLGNEVLLAPSQSCGIWLETASIDNYTNFVESNSFFIYTQDSVRSSNQYVQDCLTQPGTLPECKTFKKTHLNWTSNIDAQCPFASDLCLGLVNNSLHFDTGLIDSREDLGINSDDKNRVQYRKTATCSPISTQGYVLPYNSSQGNQSLTTYAAYYGPNLLQPSDWETDGQIINATYVTSNFEPYVSGYDASSAPAYRVAVEWAYPTSGDRGFVAIPPLQVANSSITLVFAASGTEYIGPSDDLWLPAHQLSPSGIYGTSNESVFLTDNALNVLACTEQHQFCNPSLLSNQSQRCTSLQSIDRLVTDDSLSPEEQVLGPLFHTQYQRSIVAIIRNAALMSSWSYIVESLESSLLADNLASAGISLPLASNQWTIETENWFAISMASMQRYVVNTGTGPPGIDAQYTYGVANHDPGLQEYCKNQIIQRQGFTNFSVLAIALIFTLGGTIICVSLFLEKFVGYLQVRFKRGLYSQVRWQLDSTLQLQRMAFEEVGLGTWTGGADDVPVTEKREQFAPATEWDDWHPSIRGKSATTETSICSSIGI
ncbi:hypothetical protein EG329_003179 [Mollisiaceae sp. DMI_Dod_QoI]|nr:hypothetical protein EG329_003179 [Helotiales sp. DMI_Dod_QoI]